MSPTMVVPVSRLSPELRTRELAEIESDSNIALHQAGQSAEHTVQISDASNMQDVSGSNHSADLESVHHYKPAVQSRIARNADDVEMNDVTLSRDDDEDHNAVTQFTVMSPMRDRQQCELQNGTRTAENDICRQNSVKKTENERYTVRSENNTGRQTFPNGNLVSNDINVNLAANCCVCADVCADVCAGEHQHTQSARSPVEPSLSYQTDGRAWPKRHSNENTTYRSGNRTAWSKFSVDTAPSWSSHSHVTGSDHRSVKSRGRSCDVTQPEVDVDDLGCSHLDYSPANVRVSSMSPSRRRTRSRVCRSNSTNRPRGSSSTHRDLLRGESSRRMSSDVTCSQSHQHSTRQPRTSRMINGQGVNNMDIQTPLLHGFNNYVTSSSGLQRTHSPARHCVQPAVRAACCRGIRYDGDGTRRGSSDDDVIDNGRSTEVIQGDRVTGRSPAAVNRSVCTTPRRWFHVRPSETSRQSPGLRQITVDDQCDRADLITISRKDFTEVIRDAVTTAVSESSAFPNATAATNGSDATFSNAISDARNVRFDDVQSRSVVTSKRRESTTRNHADSRSGDNSGSRRRSDRSSTRSSGHSRRRPSRGGGHGDSSSSDDRTPSNSDDGNRDRHNRNVRRSSDPDDEPDARSSPSARSHSRWVRPDKYDGTTSLETFLVKFENCVEFNQWSEKERVAHLWTSPQKEAAQLLWSAHGLTYAELVDRLRQRFGSRGLERKHEAELRYRRRGKDESIRYLAADVRRLLTLAYPGEQSRVVEHIGRDAFLTALNDPEFELKIRYDDPPDLDTAVRLAQRFEISRGMVNAASPSAKQRGISQVVDEPTAARTLELPRPRDLETMVTSVVEQTIAKVRGQKSAATAQEETTYESSVPAGLSDSKPSESRGRRGYRAQRGKKYARAVEHTNDATPRRTSDLSSAIADDRSEVRLIVRCD